ncbi:MAG TPA: hypothetical protein VE757_03860 [Gaiellaceae bacterium]|nr:hypothetical protein [Gaiellaceae bacterium]
MGEVCGAAAAENWFVRRLGLTAAGLIAVAALALVVATSGRARPNVVHTCSATDRQFIDAARTNMTAIELWSQQYESGDASDADVVGQARAAAKIMRGTGPTDWSLRQTQRLVVGMLTEYSKAVEAQEKHGNAGPHMYRAYGLANFAHTVLLHAQRPLLHLGCDVRPLL